MNISESKAMRTKNYIDRLKNKLKKRRLFVDKKESEIKTLEEKASGNYVESRCSECGKPFYTRYSYWVGSKRKPTVCSSCERLEVSVIKKDVLSYIRERGYVAEDVMFGNLRKV